MIRTIAAKEFKELLRDGRFRWSGAVVFALLFLSLGHGWRQHRELEAQHAAAQQLTREQWLDQGEKNPHSAAHYGIYAFKPQAPLAFVDDGVQPYVGTVSWLEAHNQNDFIYRPAQDATPVQRFGELTAALVLQLLVPLLIILLAFSTFAGERESGTLRQLLSLGVPGHKLAAGKALGVSSALALLIVPAAIVGAIALALGAGSEVLASDAPRVALLGLAYLSYFALITGVVLTVSASAPNARIALVVLLGFWIVNGLVAPRAAADLSQRMYPTPTSFEFESDIRAAIANGIDGHDPTDVRRAALLEETLAEYGVERAEDLPVNFAGIQFQSGEEHANGVYDHFYGQLWDTWERQSRFHQVAAVFAPALAIRSLSMGLAGTDFAQHRHFAVAAEDYRRLLNREMNLDIAQNSRPGETYLAGPDLWAAIPDFTYEPPSAQWVLAGQRVSLLVLIGWMLAAMIGLTLTTRHPRPE